MTGGTRACLCCVRAGVGGRLVWTPDTDQVRTFESDSRSKHRPSIPCFVLLFRVRNVAYVVFVALVLGCFGIGDRFQEGEQRLFRLAIVVGSTEDSRVRDRVDKQLFIREGGSRRKSFGRANKERFRSKDFSDMWWWHETKKEGGNARVEGTVPTAFQRLPGMVRVWRGSRFV